MSAPPPKQRSTQFLELYNRLDALLRARTGAPAGVSHAHLIEQLALQDPVVRNNASRLHAHRALRNSIVHSPQGGEEEAIAEPRQGVVEDYERLESYVLHPPTALDTIAIKDIYTPAGIPGAGNASAHARKQLSFRADP
jgi:hypothetical protein